MITIEIVDYISAYRGSVRRILEQIGWAEQYIQAAEHNAETFAAMPETFGVYIADVTGSMVGFIYIQYSEWNRLAQIHGLAVEPTVQRQGVALALVKRAEDYARGKAARGVYVDTPTQNVGGCKFYEAAGYSRAYVMPRYYEDTLDGVTYQKFFEEVRSN